MRGPEGRLAQVASSQVVCGDIEGALRSAESMPEGRRAMTLAMVARAQAMAGKSEEARKTIDRALADAGVNVQAPPAPNPEILVSDKVKPYPPSAVAMMQLAEIQAMAGDSAAALKSLSTLNEETYRGRALEQVVAARAAAGDVEGALDLATKDAKTVAERRAAFAGRGSNGVETSPMARVASQGGRVDSWGEAVFRDRI